VLVDGQLARPAHRCSTLPVWVTCALLTTRRWLGGNLDGLPFTRHDMRGENASQLLMTGLSRFSSVPAGSFAKAFIRRCRHREWPGRLRTWTRPASFTAAAMVLKCPETAVSTMSAADPVDALGHQRR
jgi:hypothetical protein